MIDIDWELKPAVSTMLQYDMASFCWYISLVEQGCSERKKVENPEKIISFAHENLIKLI